MPGIAAGIAGAEARGLAGPRAADRRQRLSCASSVTLPSSAMSTPSDSRGRRRAAAGTSSGTASSSPGRRSPQMRFRMRITDGDVIAVGPGKIALLEAIREAGSITAAAKRLDMSYRRAWLLIDELNRSLRTAAIDSSKGGAGHGGSVLTPAGEEIIALYRRIEHTAAAACREDIRKLMNMLAR